MNEEKTELIMKGVADALSDIFPKLGFALLVFDFNDVGLMNYISNAERENMIKALRECAFKLEQER